MARVLCLLICWLWGVSVAQALPPGVTLQGIDGGTTYYCTNGFTNACNAGWDNASFVPIGLWVAPMHTQSDADRWLDLGLNTFYGITANSDLSLLRDNNLSGIVQATELTEILAGNGSLGIEVVGLMAQDEPTTYAAAIGMLADTLNVHQDSRFWYQNYLWAQIEFGDVEGHDMPDLLNDLIVTPNSSTRHINVVSHDIYWHAGNGNTGAFNGQQLYNLGASMTQDQMRRSAHYGDMIDQMRPWQASNFPAPMTCLVENGGPYTENTTEASYIQPPEMAAAMWSCLIHGARGINIFNHSFGGPAQSDDNFAQSYYDTLYSGQSISIYDQAKTTIAQIQALAPVINSPFALGYVTVSPAGWTFGETSLSLSGFDVMAKWVTAENAFYVFAMPRYSRTTTNQTATFTVAAGTSAEVVHESRTIPITAGVFQDTFATGNTVHIYKIAETTGAVPTVRRLVR